MKTLRFSKVHGAVCMHNNYYGVLYNYCLTLQPFLHHPHVPEDAVSLLVITPPLGQVLLRPRHHGTSVPQREVVHAPHLQLAAVLQPVLEGGDLAGCLVSHSAQTTHTCLDVGDHQGIGAL